MQIVIAEDEPKSREGLIRLIRRFTDYEIAGVAENGEEGYRMVEKEKPDLVLSDIKMPVLLIAFSDLVYDLVVYLFQFFLRGRISLFFYLRRIIIPEVIYTALITLVVYRLLLALNHKLEKAEQRSVGSFV